MSTRPIAVNLAKKLAKPRIQNPALLPSPRLPLAELSRLLSRAEKIRDEMNQLVDELRRLGIAVPPSSISGQTKVPNP